MKAGNRHAAVGAVGIASGIIGMSVYATSGSLGNGQTQEVKEISRLAHIELEPVAVPIIRRGVMQGYAVLKIAVAQRPEHMKADARIVEIYVRASVFRAVFEEKLDLMGMPNAMIEKMMVSIVGDCNRALGAQKVERAILESISFVKG